MEIQNWKAQAEKELKGKSIESIILQIEEGIIIQPLLNQVEITSGISFRANSNWSIQQSFQTKVPHEWNELALQSLQGGVNKLVLQKGWSSDELKQALKNVWVAFVEFQIPSENFSMYKETLTEIANSQEKGELKESHKYIFSSEKVYDLAASHSEQLAYLILVGIEHLESSEEELDDALANLHFEWHVSNKIHVEIAKLRAFRKLWSHVLSNVSLKHACSNHCYISAITDRKFQATVDADNNLIRAAIQACAAVLGGANAIEVSPMESFLKEDHANQLRWARNIQHLLAEESYLNKYSDLALGSYSLEELTNQLLQKAWNMMNEFKDSKSLFSNIENASKQRLTEKATEVIVGQNKYVRS